MVGMMISLIVLSGLSAVYVNTSRSGRLTNTAIQLNQDLRAVMDIMVNDIRRAGFWAKANSGVNPFTTATTDLSLSNNGSCMLYSYDATYAGGTPGAVDSSASFMDFFGFRFSGGSVQTLVPTANLTSTDTSANTGMPCATDSVWENLTDQRAITITTLVFNTIGSKCISYLSSTYNPTDPTTFNTWTTTGGNGPACSPTAPGAPTAYPAGANTFVETRQISITLAARSNTDSTLARSLTETILVRNNRVITP